MQDFYGLAALMRMSFTGSDLADVYDRLIQRAAENEKDACSLLDAATILQFHGNRDLALAMQNEALKLSRRFRIPATKAVAVRLLALMAPGDIAANVPIECLLEDSDIELRIYYADSEPDLAEIPEHDVLFVAITESEANRPILAAWLPYLAEWPKPVLNNPAHIARVARNTAAELLRPLPGIAVASTWRMKKSALRQAIDANPAEPEIMDGLAFPLLVRPLGSHAGHDLWKTDNAGELASALDKLPEDELYVCPFIDYRSSDGLFRKYRVILVDGKPFACHMAISSHWMIHYLNAGMAESADKRAEEARFLENFETTFAIQHGPALAAISREIGLDYLGIDCAETRDGRLLVFEIDHAMVVHAMDPVDLYPYKQAPMHQLFAAFRTMVVDAARQNPAVSF